MCQGASLTSPSMAHGRTFGRSGSRLCGARMTAIKFPNNAWIRVSGGHADITTVPGCQYTSLAFGARCREWDVALSMGSVGDCFDNAMAESFFATLECELLDRTTLSTHAEARAAVFEFVEGWYNTRRRHSALGYVSPLEFERLQAAGPVDAFQAPTSLLEPGSPAPTRVVTGVLLETHGG